MVLKSLADYTFNPIDVEDTVSKVIQNDTKIYSDKYISIRFTEAYWYFYFDSRASVSTAYKFQNVIDVENFDNSISNCCFYADIQRFHSSFLTSTKSQAKQLRKDRNYETKNVKFSICKDCETGQWYFKFLHDIQGTTNSKVRMIHKQEFTVKCVDFTEFFTNDSRFRDIDLELLKLKQSKTGLKIPKILGTFNWVNCFRDEYRVVLQKCHETCPKWPKITQGGQKGQ